MGQRAKKPKTPKGPAEQPKPGPEPGLPDPDLPDPGSIVGEEPFTSPSGVQYRIFHTDETDAYEEPKPVKPRRPRSAKPST